MAAEERRLYDVASALNLEHVVMWRKAGHTRDLCLVIAMWLPRGGDGMTVHLPYTGACGDVKRGHGTLDGHTRNLCQQGTQLNGHLC